VSPRRDIMSDMATWVSLFIIPIGVSIATVIITNLTVGPRLAARGKRIQEYHSARDQFKDSLLDLAALCANLRGVVVPDTMEESKRARFQAERDRWEAQIGDITTWLIDHWQRYALGYVGTAEFSNLITSYAADTRGVWISARPLEDRVLMLQDINGLMITIFLGRWWSAAAKADAVARLRSMLDDIENGTHGDQAKVAPANP
jgi:hypothetical protein